MADPGSGFSQEDINGLFFYLDKKVSDLKTQLDKAAAKEERARTVFNRLSDVDASMTSSESGSSPENSAGSDQMESALLDSQQPADAKRIKTPSQSPVSNERRLVEMYHETRQLERIVAAEKKLKKQKEHREIIERKRKDLSDFIGSLKEALSCSTEDSVKNVFNRAFSTIPESIFVPQHQSTSLTERAQLLRRLRSQVNCKESTQLNNDMYIDTLHGLYQRLWALKAENTPGLAQAFRTPIEKKISLLEILITAIKGVSEHTTPMAFYIAIVLWDNMQDTQEKKTYRAIIEESRGVSSTQAKTATLLDTLKNQLLTQAERNADIRPEHVEKLRQAMKQNMEKEELSWLAVCWLGLNELGYPKFTDALKHFKDQIGTADFSATIQRMMNNTLEKDAVRVLTRESEYKEKNDRLSNRTINIRKKSVSFPFEERPWRESFSCARESFFNYRADRINRQHKNAEAKKNEIDAIQAELRRILEDNEIDTAQKIEKANKLFEYKEVQPLLDGSFAIHDYKVVFSEKGALTTTGKHLRDLRNRINSYDTEKYVFKEIENDGFIEVLHLLYQRLYVLKPENHDSPSVAAETTEKYTSFADTEDVSAPSMQQPAQLNSVQKQEQLNQKINAIKSLIKAIQSNADKKTPLGFYNVIVDWEENNGEDLESLKVPRGSQFFSLGMPRSESLVITMKNHLLDLALKNGQISLEGAMVLQQKSGSSEAVLA